ncbi:MAG: response regulator transcription factor [Candidatus Thorarchaeota archaeon]
MTTRIFIVDDEPEIPELMGIALRKFIDDFEVISALNGEDAIELVKKMLLSEMPPHITLMDLRMPKIDGIECTRILTELGVSNIHILSAYLNPELIDQAVAAGAKGILQKSEGFKVIAEKIAGMAHRSG